MLKPEEKQYPQPVKRRATCLQIVDCGEGPSVSSRSELRDQVLFEWKLFVRSANCDNWKDRENSPNSTFKMFVKNSVMSVMLMGSVSLGNWYYLRVGQKINNDDLKSSRPNPQCYDEFVL